MTVGRKATVWDGEVAGLEGALRMVSCTPVLLLTDSRAAIQAVQKAGRRGVARTRGLAEVVRRLAAIDEENGGGSAILGWVKAHIGISGNEREDGQVKLAAGGRGGMAVTEGGIRAECRERRQKERVVSGFGSGRVVRWTSRYAITAFSQLRTNKGLLASWLMKIGRADSDLCWRCSVEGTGSHEALACMTEEEWGRRWSTWAHMDEKVRWKTVEKGPDRKEIVIDLMEEWFDEW